MRKLTVLFLLWLRISGSAQPAIPEESNATAGSRNAFTTVPPPAVFEFSDILGTYPTSTFTIEWQNFPAGNPRTAFERAARIWEFLLISFVPIKVRAIWDTLPSGTLAVTETGGYRSNLAGLQANTGYPIALAERIVGQNLNGDTADIKVTVNSNLSSKWYYGTDGNTPQGKFDFVTLVHHELAHGLGFDHTFRVEGGSIGRWGYGVPRIPDIYDRYCGYWSHYPPTDLLISNPDSSTQLGNKLRSDNIFFAGVNAREVNGFVIPKLFAPGTWKGGSSISHLDEALYPAGTRNSLMTPDQDSAEATHTPGEIGLSVLEDLGWGVNRVVTIVQPVAAEVWHPGYSYQLQWSDNRQGALYVELWKKNPSSGQWQHYRTLPDQPSSQRGLNPPYNLSIPSDVVTGDYKIKMLDDVLGYGLSFAFRISSQPQVALPTITPNGGTFTTGQSVPVTLACTTDSVTIRYTRNGPDPDTLNSIIYGGPGSLTLTADCLLKVKAFRTGYEPSVMAAANFWFVAAGNWTYFRQLDSSNVPFDSVGIWEPDSTWHYVLPTRRISMYGYTGAGVKASQEYKAGTKQKVHSWFRDNTPVTAQNHGWVDIDRFHPPNTITAPFVHTTAAIVKAELIEGGTHGGLIFFKDPWLVDSVTNRGPLNRGMNALFYQKTSGFNPDTSATYKGVFLNQVPDPNDPNKPYYSVGALLQQNFGGVQGTFQYWSGSNVTFRSGSKDTSAVVFQQPGATASAMYKGPLLSSQSNATGSSNQRKLASHGGNTYAVYPSGGSIWFTMNGGSGWSGEKLVCRGAGARNPSIAVSVNGAITYLHVVWDDDYDGVRAVFYSRSSNGGVNWTTSEALSYRSPVGTDIAPALAATADQAVVVWSYPDFPDGGLYMRAMPTNGTVAPYVRLRSATEAARVPSIDAFSNFKIAYRQGSSIVYDEFSLDGAYYPVHSGDPVVLSNISGMNYVGTPSITSATEHPIGYTPHAIVAWDAEMSGVKKVIVRERVGFTTTWNSPVIISPSGSAPQNVNVVASFDQKTLRFVLLWQADYHIDQTSRPITGGSWRAPQDLGTGTYPSLPGFIGQIAQSTALWTLAAGSYYEIHPAPIGLPHLESLTINSLSTGSQRKIVRNEQSGMFYLTYDLDGDILVTRSANGSDWEPEQCVSRGYTDCSAPCIAERSGTVYVVWQKGTEPTYDIMYSVSANSGVSWSNPVTLQTVESRDYPPNPVVAAAFQEYDPIDLMIVYRGNGRLRSAYTTIGVPGLEDWQFEEVAETHDGSRDPSIASAPENYPPLRLAWSDGAQVYFQNYYPGEWQPPVIVNNGIAGSVYENYNTSLAYPTKPSPHIVWQGLRPPWQEIIHNYDLNPSVFTEFVYPYYNHFTAPSIAGRQDDGAVLMLEGPYNSLYKAIYEGGYWSALDAYEGLTTPSLSVSNPPGAFAHFVACSPYGPPYALRFGTEESWEMGLKGTDGNAAPLRPTARRVVISSRNKNESLSFEVSSPVMENSVDSLLSFVQVVDTVRYTAQTVWSLLETPSFTVRSHELPLRIKHSVHGWRSRTLRDPILNIPALLEVVHAGTNSVLAQQMIVPALSDSGTTLHGIARLHPTIAAATPIKFRLRLNRAFPHQQFNAAVVNVFKLDTMANLARRSVAEEERLTPTQYAMHPSYPNPFNPSTTIKFDLPENSNVSLVVYDVLGRKVTELASGYREAGYHSVIWNGTDLASGVYIARFTVRDELGKVKFSKINKLVLMK